MRQAASAPNALLRVLLSPVVLGLMLLSGVLVSEIRAESIDFAVTESSFTPTSITVGDRVEMRVVIRADDPDAIQLPDEYPSSQWIEVRNMRMIRRDEDREIRIEFSPFRTGTLTMPDIDLGAMTLSGSRFVVESVLPDDDAGDLAAAEPPGFLPGFQVLALGLVVLLIGAPFALYQLVLAVRRRVGLMIASYRANRPYRRILRKMRELRTLFESMGAREFYIHLVDEVRIYLTIRLHPDFMVATANEIPLLLQEQMQDEDLRSYLTELFHRADLVKFAFADSSSAERRHDLESIVELIAIVENRKAKRVRRRATRPVRRITSIEAG